MPRFESSSPVENAPGRRRHRRGLLLGAIAAPLLASGCIGTPTSGLERMENAIGQGEMSIDEPRIIIDSRGIVDLEVDGGCVADDDLGLEGLANLDLAEVFEVERLGDEMIRLVELQRAGGAEECDAACGHEEPELWCASHVLSTFR